MKWNKFTDESDLHDYKKVDNDETTTPLSDNIFVDCAYQGKFLGQNYYVIGILGTTFQQSGMAYYYLAKFSTKFNLTEYFYKSQVDDVLELGQGVYVDSQNQMIYAAVEINKNIYNNQTVYSPGDYPPEDNSNIAILGFSWTHGVLMWTTVIGNQFFGDEFARMSNLGNDVVVFLNSYSTKYSTNSSQHDIYYYRMRSSNGYIQAKKVFGSPQDDIMLDLQVTFNGKVPNLAIIWMNFYDSIQDIEGYILSKFSHYPTRFFVTRSNWQTNYDQTFIFYSQRQNSIEFTNVGLYLTQSKESIQMYFDYYKFKKPVCEDTTGCLYCSAQYVSVCIRCQAGYFLFKHKCYLSGCPNFAYSLYNEANVLINICGICHYSCLTCIGPLPSQCTTCCMNNVCGAVQNRVPSLGRCDCPSGLLDSNGICEQKCVLNLKGNLNNYCYQQCPFNSFPLLQFDQLTSQPSTQYDLTSKTDCQISSSHLLFQSTGKGLAVEGPDSLAELPSQFTVSFWVYPMSLNAESYFLNVFSRIQITAKSANNYLYVYYQTSDTTIIQPVYSIGAFRTLLLNTWNYVTFSQREIYIGGTFVYEMQLSLSTGNTATVYSAGYDNTQPVKVYTLFVNKIYIGSQSDMYPQSFQGFLKEVKVFTKYHSFAQIKADQMRMYRYYSYDVEDLISYWKLNETYTQSDILYTIKDYSINANQISYSILQHPDYPVYVIDQYKQLSMCVFHDVAMCQSVDYRMWHYIVQSPYRIINQPAFNVKSYTYSYTIKNGDEIWFVSNNTKCTRDQVKGLIWWSGGTNNTWLVRSQTTNPLFLNDSTHYQVCFYISSLNVSFNLFELYLMGMPPTVDPSNSDGYMQQDAQIEWMTVGGDQAAGDDIRFSEDCHSPESTDYTITRSYTPDYGKQNITFFPQQGNFYFCWQHVYVQEQVFSYFDSIYDLKFRIVGDPTVGTNSPNIVYMNENIVNFEIEGVFNEGDKLTFAWPGIKASDCNPDNFLGQIYKYNNSHWPSIWFGYQSGIHGILNYSMDTIHMCYQSTAKYSSASWIRLKTTNGNMFFISFLEYNILPNTQCPELLSFDPQYGSSSLYETDLKLMFFFNPQTVYPSLAQDIPSPVIYGMLYIYRGAIQPDGTIVKTSYVLWSNTALNDFLTPNPLQQGDLMCTSDGQCTILLSQQANRMKAGEIYFLSFFKNSFAAKPNPSSHVLRYYLFDNLPLDTSLTPAIFAGLTSAYDHMFFCRSFDIPSSTQLINGRVFSMQGVDLYSKVINAKEENGLILNDIFTTKSINIVMTVLNTLSTQCISNAPIATVEMRDVTQTGFTVYNLELRECNEGKLFADIEVTRGIVDAFGQFTHLRKEIQKNIQLGNIGCDYTCFSCNGTTYKDCILCANSSEMIYQGACYGACPNEAPYSYTLDNIFFQSKVYSQSQCLSECPFGLYADQETKKCLECNLECQTCNSSNIASCITCAPVAYLYKGICLPSCPEPLTYNYTDYSCISPVQQSPITVQIQSLGYLQKIPKNNQAYLKAFINNTRGTIGQIYWSQIAPDSSSNNDLNVFTEDESGHFKVYTAVVKLNMESLGFMATNEVIKVKVVVTNSYGDFAFDIYEFYKNNGPQVGQVNYQVVSESKYNGTSISSLYSIKASNWSFIGSSLNQYISIMVGDNFYQVTDTFLYNSTYFHLPLLSRTESALTVILCFNAFDQYQAFQTSCQTMMNVSNDISYYTNLDKLFTYLLTLQLDKNISNALYASQSLQVVLDVPLRLASQDGVCTIDSHCYNGECVSSGGINYCICQDGYGGTFCKYTLSQINTLYKVSQQIVMSIHTVIMNKNNIQTYDIQLAASVLRGVLVDPDIVTDAGFTLMLDIVERIKEASIYAYQPLSDAMTSQYLEVLNLLILKLYHNYKIKRAYPDVYGEAQGLSIKEQYALINNLGGKKRMLGMQEEPMRGQGLIGGKKGRREERKLSMKEAQKEMFQEQGRVVDQCVQTFLDMMMQRLNPTKPIMIYRGLAVQFYASSDYAKEYKEKTIYVTEKDANWNIPMNIFISNQNEASDVQEVRLLAIKYLYNPFLLETNPYGFVESNVTQLSFYNTKNAHMSIQMSNDTYISIEDPWNKTQSYEIEQLLCMRWDDSTYSFANDNQCSFNSIWDEIPCDTCPELETYNTSVALCRCQHLSRFAAVYSYMSTVKRGGIEVGIYSDYFAMNFWRKSFGFYAVVSCVAIFLIGHFVLFFVDRSTQPQVLMRLRERVRKLEMKGFKQNKDQKALGFGQFFNGKNDKNLKEEQKKGEEVIQEEIKNDEENVSPVIDLAKKRKSKLAKRSKKMRKKPLKQNEFQEDQLTVNDQEQAGLGSTWQFNQSQKKQEEKMSESSRSLFKKEKKVQNQDQVEEYKEEEEKQLFNQKEENNSPMINQEWDTSDEEEKFQDGMMKKYEAEQKDKELGHAVEDNDSAEELASYSKEQQKFLRLNVLLMHGNHLSSIIFVTSLLSPRHVRWTMMFSCLAMNWFWCALIYNNTKNPLILPDSTDKTHGIDPSDIWICFISPVGSIILMYVLAGLFKISDKRLQSSYTSNYLDSMLIELKKETRLRFTIAYIIVFSIYCAIFWYVIKFSATFGWITSWQWFYIGFYSLIIQFCFYDPGISAFHWLTYKCSPKLAKVVMKVRITKQGNTEA